MLNKLCLWLFARLFQFTSMGSYAVSIWAYLGWAENPEGVNLLEIALKGLLAFLLFVFNEKPWIAKLKG